MDKKATYSGLIDCFKGPVPDDFIVTDINGKVTIIEHPKITNGARENEDDKREDCIK